ncbi:MAG TPA: hypothetical protein VNJ12_09320 [Candidatus Dormibacteraeota bacterium]|nr:hypothetical protein [Candidatus Dormibacteraeota bacterium]
MRKKPILENVSPSHRMLAKNQVPENKSVNRILRRCRAMARTTGSLAVQLIPQLAKPGAQTTLERQRNLW